jgi:hypothetical protein
MPAVAELRCGDERVSREFEARTQSPNLFHGEPSGLPPEAWKQQFLIRIRESDRAVSALVARSGIAQRRWHRLQESDSALARDVLEVGSEVRLSQLCVTMRLLHNT